MKIFKNYKELTKSDKLRIFRLIIFTIVMLFIIFFSFKLIDVVNKLSDETYRIAFKEKISNMGFLGVILILGLQIIQIFVAVIPGQPVEVIIGMLYGTYLGVLISTIGIFIGTALVYYTVKKIGRDIIELFFKPSEIDKVTNLKIFQYTSKLEIFLIIIFLIPAIPKDLFIYLGAITKIKPKRFLLIATLPRIPGLFLTVYAGSKLTEGSYLIAAIVTIIVIIFWTTSFYINKVIQKMDKNK